MNSSPATPWLQPPPPAPCPPPSTALGAPGGGRTLGGGTASLLRERLPRAGAPPPPTPLSLSCLAAPLHPGCCVLQLVRGPANEMCGRTGGAGGGTSFGKDRVRGGGRCGARGGSTCWAAEGRPSTPLGRARPRASSLVKEVRGDTPGLNLWRGGGAAEEKGGSVGCRRGQGRGAGTRPQKAGWLRGAAHAAPTCRAPSKTGSSDQRPHPPTPAGVRSLEGVGTKGGGRAAALATESHQSGVPTRRGRVLEHLL